MAVGCNKSILASDKNARVWCDNFSRCKWSKQLKARTSDRQYGLLLTVHYPKSVAAQWVQALLCNFCGRGRFGQGNLPPGRGWVWVSGRGVMPLVGEWEAIKLSPTPQGVGGSGKMGGGSRGGCRDIFTAPQNQLPDFAKKVHKNILHLGVLKFQNLCYAGFRKGNFGR